MSPPNVAQTNTEKIRPINNRKGDSDMRHSTCHQPMKSWNDAFDVWQRRARTDASWYGLQFFGRILKWSVRSMTENEMGWRVQDMLPFTIYRTNSNWTSLINAREEAGIGMSYAYACHWSNKSWKSPFTKCKRMRRDVSNVTACDWSKESFRQLIINCSFKNLFTCFVFGTFPERVDRCKFLNT